MDVIPLGKEERAGDLTGSATANRQEQLLTDQQRQLQQQLAVGGGGSGSSSAGSTSLYGSGSEAPSDELAWAALMAENRRLEADLDSGRCVFSCRAQLRR